MSKELLKRVGEFIYGEQWQAPLARDLGVSERSMRRWVAGTDEIPVAFGAISAPGLRFGIALSDTSSRR